MSKQANPLLAAALEYARLGWPVIPLHHPVNGQCSCGDPECTHQAKHPRIRRWQSQATCNEATIKKWWASWPNANVGIATGDHLLVIDHDHGELPGEAPTGPVVKTAKGHHYYVQAPSVIVENWVKVNGTGLDLRTTGGLVVAPPSVHISGEPYEWVQPPQGTLPPAPTWLLELIAKQQAPSPAAPSPNPSQGGGGVEPYAQAAFDGEIEKVHLAPHGQRNEQLNRSSFALGTLVGAGALDEATVAAALMAAAAATGLGASEIHKTVRSGLAAGKKKPRTIDPPQAPAGPSSADRDINEPIRWNAGSYINDNPGWLSRDFVIKCLNEEEFGDAKLLDELYHGRLIFDHAERQWYLWTGHAWYPDRTGMIRQLVAGQVARQYMHLAAELQTEAQQNDQTGKIVGRLLTRAGNLRKLNRCNNVREFASNLMAMTGDEWDRDPWLLGVANGVLDLRTGKIRPGQPEDFIRTVSDTTWRGLDTPAPRFELFIREIFDDDEEIVGFVQRLLGYGITGLSVEHIFPVLWGEKGRNGKDTLLETLKAVLGDLADVVSTDVLMAQTGRGNAAPHLMDLMGRRLVWASETADGARLNEAQVKLITGGGTIKTRPLYGAMVEFDPTHLVLLITNHKPKVSAEDEALWSRMVLVPFVLRFVEHPSKPEERKRDLHLLKKLAQEKSGILAWLVRGCMDWQKHGLQTPEKIRASTQAYRDEEDVLGKFLESECVIHPSAIVGAKALYSTYRNWAEESGMTALNQMNFGKRIVKRFERKHTHKGFIYSGVGLQTDYPDPLIPLIPFSQKSLMSQDRLKTFEKRDQGDQGISFDDETPPPGEGENRENGEGGSVERVLVAKHGVQARLDYVKEARCLLREVGTTQEICTDLDGMTTNQIIQLCRQLQQRIKERP